MREAPERHSKLSIMANQSCFSKLIELFHQTRIRLKESFEKLEIIVFEHRPQFSILFKSKIDSNIRFKYSQTINDKFNDLNLYQSILYFKIFFLKVYLNFSQILESPSPRTKAKFLDFEKEIL